MRNPDDVFRLLEQMRNARAGQRIVIEPGLDVSVETADEGKDERTGTDEDRGPEDSEEEDGQCPSQR